MNCIHVLAILGAVVASCSAAPACGNVVDVVTPCLSDNGLNMTDLQKQMSGNGLDAQAYKDQCAHLPQYEKAMQCIIQEFNRCSFGDSIIPLSSLTKMSQSMGAMCNDPKINIDCMAQVSKQHSQIQSCVTSNMGTVNYTKPIEQITCDSAKVGMKCTTDILKSCDQYTATFVENQMKVAFPQC